MSTKRGHTVCHIANVWSFCLRVGHVTYTSMECLHVGRILECPTKHYRMHYLDHIKEKHPYFPVVLSKIKVLHCAPFFLELGPPLSVVVCYFLPLHSSVPRPARFQASVKPELPSAS